jgi:transposase
MTLSESDDPFCATSLFADRLAGQGEPYAVQVADRFHLLQNLAKTLEQVRALHRQGESVAAIVQQVGVSQGTVYNDLRTATFPEYEKPSCRLRSVLSLYWQWAAY